MCFYRSCTFLLSYRAEAPTLRMGSGQISITFPIRLGAQVAAVKSEILKQLQRVTADNGTLSVQVSSLTMHIPNLLLCKLWQSCSCIAVILLHCSSR